jgi:hypothetical protein
MSLSVYFRGRPRFLVSVGVDWPHTCTLWSNESCTCEQAFMPALTWFRLDGIKLLDQVRNDVLLLLLVQIYHLSMLIGCICIILGL